MVLLVLLSIVLWWSSKVNLASSKIPKCFWDLQDKMLTLLNTKGGFDMFFNFLLKMTSWACLLGSDFILYICLQEPLLISKKCIVLLHTLSAYKSLFVRYKVYSSDPRESFCTSWRYAEAYENFSIDPAPCQKDPIKKK